MKRLTTIGFIERAIRVHGNRYDYSLSKYIHATHKVAIACQDHGTFYQRPNDHVNNKHGCPWCGQPGRTEFNTHPHRVTIQVQPDEYKIMPLTKGIVCVVDNIDFILLKSINWSFHSKGYAFNSVAGYMHRYIMGCPKGLFVDHIDGNGLNNRRSNLRICTHDQNMQNRATTIGSSIYKGVHFGKTCNKWIAQIRCSNKSYYLGAFLCEIEAARAYDKKAKELHGEFARLNFPNE